MDTSKFSTIEGYDTWTNVVLLTKGWSDDKKYIVTDNKGDKYLLRISSINLYDEKEKQFEVLQKVSDLNINASKPISFGKLNDEEIYMMLTWLEGIDTAEAMKSLNDKDAYLLGINAGETLAKLHKINVDTTNEPKWIDKYAKKMQRKIKALEECPLEIPNKELLIKYVNENIHLLENRPLSFTHGDYHAGNLIVNNNKIGVIDFDKNKISDPYDDLKPFMWNVAVSEYFATGVINGYFNNKIPNDFFPILTLYAVEQLISFIPWACKFGEEEINKGYKMHTDTMYWFNNLNDVVPTWYKGIINY